MTSRRTLTAEARVRHRVSECGTGFRRVFRVSPVKIILLLLTILVALYDLRNTQYDRWWLQFRDIVSLHRREQNHYYGLFIDYLTTLLQ
jgi:hypothetical protein